MLNKEIRKLFLIISIIFIMIYMRFQNFDFLNDIEVELQFTDVTFMLVVLRDMIPKNMICLFVLLVLAVLDLIFVQYNKVLMIVKLFSLILITLTVCMILIFSFNYTNEHLYSIVIQGFCILSFIFFPSFTISVIQILLYISLFLLMFVHIHKILSLCTYKNQKK